MVRSKPIIHLDEDRRQLVAYPSVPTSTPILARRPAWPSNQYQPINDSGVSKDSYQFGIVPAQDWLDLNVGIFFFRRRSTTGAILIHTVPLEVLCCMALHLVPMLRTESSRCSKDIDVVRLSLEGA